jgi:TetR/AcrR family transcriptional regulator, mexJK operon transcriptional repressor
MSQVDLPPPGVSVPAKRRQILDGARLVFAELGFERASVDLIASRAGVSKPTIYKHYEDKKALFVACVAQDAEELRAGLRACTGDPAGDVEQTLQIVGEKMMRLFLSPGVLAFYRHVIAETANLPGLGKTLFARGPGVIQATIAGYLERWNHSGALRIEDPHVAAVQFVSLCQGDLLTRARFGILGGRVHEQVRETVARAVRTFVRAHRP